MQEIVDITSHSNDWLKDFDITIMAAFFGFTVALMLMAIAKQISIWRGAGKMNRQEEDRVKGVFADILVEGAMYARLREAGEEGYLEAKVANEWLRKFGNILSIRDLVPRNEMLLKDMLAAKHLASPEVTSTKPVTEAPKAKVKKSILDLLRNKPAVA